MANEPTGKLEIHGPMSAIMRAMRAFNNEPEPAPRKSAETGASYQDYLRQKDAMSALQREIYDLHLEADRKDDIIKNKNERIRSLEARLAPYEVGNGE